ncbi:unnamed protein product [Calypogeia fissa]
MERGDGTAGTAPVGNADGYSATQRDRPGNPRTSIAESKNDISFGKLLKHHLRDWLMVVVVAIVEIIVYVVIPPFHRFVSRFNIDDYRYPRETTTVPTWSVLLIAVLAPLVGFFIFFIRRRSVRDFHNAFLGLATAIALTALLTDSIKNTVGMPRPDFFLRCFPDRQDNYDPITQGVICHGSSNDIRDGYKSFPSGHASWSFAGLGYLSMYLTGKLGVFDKRGWTSRVVIVFIPLLCATLVAVSRVDNYQHRWWDCIFGAFLGLIVAYFNYRSHFPSVFSDNAGFPYKYIPGTEAHSSVPSGPTRQAIGEDDPAMKNGPARDMESGGRDLRQ